MDAPVPFERLLAERAWLRQLARRLVADPGAIDDLEQETWRAALDARPRAAAVRGWLAAVMRNALFDRLRAERSRVRREHAVARREATPAAADVVARAELQRRLVLAVFELDAAHRDALLLRFFEDLPFAEVGARLGVTPDAARMRVRRAIEILRERLDREDRGGGEWRAALVAWLGTAHVPRARPGAGPRVAARTGGLAMAASSKVVGVVGAALLAGVALWGASALRDDPTDDLRRADTESAALAEANAEPERSRQRARSAAPETEPSKAPADSAQPEDERPEDWAVRVRTNVPGAEVTLAFTHYGSAPESPPVTKRADGRGFAGFDLPEHPEGIAAIEACGRADGYAPARATVVAASDLPLRPGVPVRPRVAAETADGGEATLTLERGVPVRGRVVSEGGEPVAEAAIRVDPDRWTVSAADGAFEAWPESAGPCVLRVAHPAHRVAAHEAVAPAEDVRIVLSRGLAVRGRVTFPDLSPVPGVGVSARADGRQVATTTGDDGSYVLSGLEEGDVALTCSAGDASLTTRAGAADADFVVRSAVARIRFVDEAGMPFRHAGALVRGFAGDDEIYSMGAGGDAEGVLVVDVPPGTLLRISPSARGYESRLTDVALDADPSFRDVPVVIRRAGPAATLALRVLDAQGAPVRATVVTLEDAIGSPVEGLYGRRIDLDSEGRARLEGVPAGTLRLTVGGAPLAVPSESFDLPHLRDVAASPGAVIPVDVALVPGGRVSVTVRGPTGEAVAPRGRIALRGPDGRRVEGMFWQPNAQGGWTTSSDPDAAAPMVFGPAVPAGRYRVRLEREGAEAVECEVGVTAGRVAEVDLRLPE